MHAMYTSCILSTKIVQEKGISKSYTESLEVRKFKLKEFVVSALPMRVLF